MYSDNMKKVMTAVRTNLKTDKWFFSGLYNMNTLDWNDISSKRQYLSGMVAGFWLANMLTMDEYVLVKKYIKKEYKRLRDCYLA